MGMGGQRHAPAALPPGKRSSTHWWAQQPVRTGIENLTPPPEFDHRTVQRVASHYTDWATAAHEIRGLINWFKSLHIITVNLLFNIETVYQKNCSKCPLAASMNLDKAYYWSSWQHCAQPFKQQAAILNSSWNTSHYAITYTLVLSYARSKLRSFIVREVLNSDEWMYGWTGWFLFKME
jgi:hypothetical protein